MVREGGGGSGAEGGDEGLCISASGPQQRASFLWELEFASKAQAAAGYHERGTRASWIRPRLRRPSTFWPQFHDSDWSRLQNAIEIQANMHTNEAWRPGYIL